MADNKKFWKSVFSNAAENPRSRAGTSANYLFSQGLMTSSEFRKTHKRFQKKIALGLM